MSVGCTLPSYICEYLASSSPVTVESRKSNESRAWLSLSVTDGALTSLPPCVKRRLMHSLVVGVVLPLVLLQDGIAGIPIVSVPQIDLQN